MKVQLIILSIILSSLSSAFAQGSCTLTLENHKLKGNCAHRYYKSFEIELDTYYTVLDSVNFFNQFPRIGKVSTRNHTNIPTEYTITERAGFPQIMFRSGSSYFTFDNLKFDSQDISFKIYRDPQVPATKADLRIVKIAKKILSNKDNWHKEDDRTCDDDIANNSYSLYCALRIASLEVEEKYNHRNAALQKLRHLIELKYPNKKWNHRLMDFNNMKETNHEDIVGILAIMEQDFTDELNSKK